MATSVMIDLETVDTKNTAAILSLGAVKFDPFSKEEPHSPIYVLPDVDEQFARGRTASESTLNWWGQQDKEAQDAAFSGNDRISIHSVLDQLNRYLVGVDKVWANGTMFDIGILENLYQQYDRPVPWQYWQIRDARTVYDMGDDSAKTGNEALHNALADAYCQAVAVQNIYNELQVKPSNK